jgi:TRAP-type C4-dicarboxylate transport system substrate-binding protein
MTMLSRRTLCTSLAATASALALPRLAAAAPGKLRFATLVPRGSVYHRALQEVGEAWRHAEGQGAQVTVFTDGVQGDELDIVRRMRIGQLNGALISVVGLNAIEPGAAPAWRHPAPPTSGTPAA